MAKKKYKASVLNRINQQKSNRMIIAVSIGVGVILLIWLIAMLSSGEKGPPQVVAEKALKYLDKTDGIATVKIDMENDRVDIRYDYTKPGDFVLITRYAALKLSNSLPDRSIDFTLTPDQPPDQSAVYRCMVQDGGIQSQWQGELPKPPAENKEEPKKEE